MSKNNLRASAALGPRSAVLEFSTALARTIFSLAALSPREFRHATEAGSTLSSTPRSDPNYPNVPQNANFSERECSKTEYNQ